MALVLGVNAGFVTTAPTSDPQAQTGVIDDVAMVSKYTSPVDAGKITEIGWWCDNATEEANFEVGLYAADGGVVPGEAGTRLFVDVTNAKGTGSGWKTVTVDWTISPSTDYWIGVQLDDTSPNTIIDLATSGGGGRDLLSPATSLPSPFGGGDIISPGFLLAFYAVWEEAVAGVTRKIKIAGTFQDKPIKTKVAGTFVEKPIKVKVAGVFQ